MFPGHPESWTPLQIPSWGPPLGCTLLQQFCLVFVLNLLSSFWLCKEAKCIYLCPHLGWQSAIVSKRFYLFTFREGGKEGEGEGDKHQSVRDTSIGCLSHDSNWGPGPKPWHMPWLGLEPGTFRFEIQHSMHWATPAGAPSIYFFNWLVEFH